MIRIPADFELPSDEVLIHRDGDRLVIESIRSGGLLATLASLQPLDPADVSLDIDDSLPPLDTVDL